MASYELGNGIYFGLLIELARAVWVIFGFSFDKYYDSISCPKVSQKMD